MGRDFCDIDIWALTDCLAVESLAKRSSAAYGLDALPNDAYMTIAKEALHPAFVAAVPGIFWVTVLHWLKYVPEWTRGLTSPLITSGSSAVKSRHC